MTKEYLQQRSPVHTAAQISVISHTLLEDVRDAIKTGMRDHPVFLCTALDAIILRRDALFREIELAKFRCSGKAKTLFRNSSSGGLGSDRKFALEILKEEDKAALEILEIGSPGV